jgi:nucleolar MIF4G domain-containing protein 1
MNKNFLSRKTLRRNKREEKKQKKNQHYQQKFGKNKFDNTNKLTGNNNFKKSFNKEKDYDDEDEEVEDIEDNDNVEEIDDDEEIDSDMASDKDSFEGEPEDNQVKGNTFTENDEFDKEVKFLEKRLEIKKGKNYDLYKKRLTKENHDPDLMDFLDGIDKSIFDIKSNKYENNIPSDPKNKPKTSTKSKKMELIEEEPVESLEQIKSKSKLFSNSNIKQEDQIKMTFQKEITSLINKISEANLNLMLPDFISKLNEFEKSKVIDKSKVISETVTKISLRMTLDGDVTNLPITSCVCSYVSILHYKYGNSFMLYFTKSMFEKFDEFIKNQKKAQLKNFIFTIIQFYVFGNISSKLYYDIIKFFIENFNDIYSEMLLIMLTYIGIDIRKEDPDSLKDIINNVHVKYNTIVAESRLNNINSGISSKMKYLVEMIDEIKNNKYMKFNASEKFTFFKNFVNTNKKNFINESDINSESFADKIDISLSKLKELDKNNIEDFSHINVDVAEIDDDIEVDDNIMTVDNVKVDKLLKKFKITTDLKKKIFVSVINSMDYLDAFEAVTRLNLKKEQSREIIKILVLLAIEEKSYNPFYKLLIDKLIFVDKTHKYTFHYTIWDHMKLMDNYSTRKLHNLANLVSDLLASEKLAIPVILPFEFEDSSKPQITFINYIFDMYFEKSTIDKTKLLFAKLVKNDDHVEFAKQLFNYFVNVFKKHISFDNKSNQYIENYSAATRVLKKIL